MPELAFVLVERPAYPDPRRLIEAAAAVGLTLTEEPREGDGPIGFGLPNGGTLFVLLIEAPHPDVPHMPRGPLSPPHDVMEAAPAHYVVTALGLEGEVDALDAQMAGLTAAVIRASPAIAAMLGHGVLFHRADLFADIASASLEHDEPPVELTVDLTAAREPDGRMSFLTHGMRRYAREELYVTAPVDGTGALDFIMTMARWLVTDRDKELPTGDTVGRTAEERIEVRRVPSPTGEGPDVIRLDLA